VARAFAKEVEIVPGVPATCGVLVGAVFCCFGRRGGDAVSLTGFGLISGDGGEAVGCSGVGVDTGPGLISSDGGGAVSCCSVVEAAPRFSEGLAAIPAPFPFCKEGISFWLASNLVCNSVFSFCNWASSATAFAALFSTSEIFSSLSATAVSRDLRSRS